MNKQLVLPIVLGVIVFGFGYANVAFAANDENPNEAIIGVSVGPDGMLSGSISMSPATYTGLESVDVGTLPTSPLYFLKQWGRGITRLLTFGSIAKAQLELNITNQIAAEVLEVNNANPDDTNALKKALENFTNAQERLNFRITTINGTSNVADSERFLKAVDEKTAKHTALLEQLTEKYSDQLRFEVVGDSLKKANNNIQKTFTVTVTPVNDAPSLKQKVEDQIKLAGVAIEEANSAMGDVSTTRGVKIEDDESNIFDRWGNSIAKAKSHLESAKKAFAEEKYGEAYGLARSVEAIVSGVRVAVGDINGDGRADKAVPASPAVISSEEVQIGENESPRPTDRQEESPAGKSTPEKQETPETKSTTTPASDTTNSSGAGSQESTRTENKTETGTTVKSGASLQLQH